MGFLDLPTELRLVVYLNLFGKGTATLDGGQQVTDSSCETSCLIPAAFSRERNQPRSAQVLRVCKAILYEARPLLYANTVFASYQQDFAGKLPARLSAGNPTAAFVKHLTWQLRCDLLKQFYPEDFDIDTDDLSHIESLELRCHVENWRNAVCGEWCDKDAVIKGEEQMTNYAERLRSLMPSPTNLVKDATNLNRGRLILRLTRRPENLTGQRPR